MIGFERRTIHVDGMAYSWHEYVLFNPFKGFRYLTEYNGHWNDVQHVEVAAESFSRESAEGQISGRNLQAFSDRESGNHRSCWANSPGKCE